MPDTKFITRLRQINVLMSVENADIRDIQKAVNDIAQMMLDTYGVGTHPPKS